MGPKNKECTSQNGTMGTVSPRGSFPNQVFSNIVALNVYCCGLLLIALFIYLFVTAAFHALILFIFYLLISVLSYPELVLFQQQNIFIIKNKQEKPYTNSKQQERHIKNTVRGTL